MWRNLQGTDWHRNIARHFWVICHDSSVTVCTGIAGDLCRYLRVRSTDISAILSICRCSKAKQISGTAM